MHRMLAHPVRRRRERDTEGSDVERELLSGDNPAEGSPGAVHQNM